MDENLSPAGELKSFGSKKCAVDESRVVIVCIAKQLNIKCSFWV